MGHLNTRHYMAAFDDVGMHTLTALGFDFAEAQRGTFGWADVQVKLDLKAEIPLGELFQVESAILRIGGSSLTIRHTMSGVKDGAVEAVADVISVHFDLQKRKSAPVPEAIRDRAAALLITQAPNEEGQVRC